MHLETTKILTYFKFQNMIQLNWKNGQQEVIKESTNKYTCVNIN